ncbi:MAG: bile acid:sodium symporter family protein [Pseudomonadota bacterium]
MLLDVFLPLSLAFIMFSLGLGLTIADFTRVVRVSKAFAIGAVAQIALLPAVAYLLLQVFSLPPELALGVMILSFCPGGVTSNILTKLANGAVALSVTLTAVVSLVSVVTVPLLVDWSATEFMGLATPDVDIGALAIAMFAITAVPVAIGVAIRHFATGFADAAEVWVSRLANVLFVVIVIGALATNWALFMENLAVLGPVLILMNVALLALGVLMAKLGGLDARESTAISLEVGVQNATLGITVGGLIAAEAAGVLPAYALPAGVYGITMYLVSAPFVLWARSRK